RYCHSDLVPSFPTRRSSDLSDLYAVFVGNLADRIAGGGDFVTPWGGTGPQKTRNIEEIQQRLMSLGYDVEKIDGKVGSNTRKVRSEEHTSELQSRENLVCRP